MFYEASQWSYDTGATGGLGIGYFAASGGAVYLKAPDGSPQRFIFGGIGAGLSGKIKIPKVKLPNVAIKGKAVAGAFSTKSLPSGGLIFRSAKFGNRELTVHDIRGAVLFIEGAAGLIVGVSGDAMLFGMNPLMLATGLANPAMSFLTAQAMADAAGVMLFGGINVGVQAGYGIAALVGYMY
jgi:hypothetical protein